MYVSVGPPLPADRVGRLVAGQQHLDCALDMGGSRGTDSAETCRVYQAVLQDVLPGPWHLARLFLLGQGSHIHLHADAPIQGTRYHLPLQCNPDCWVVHDGTWQQLDEGQLYQMDPTRPHGAVNWGSTLRVHLMVDLPSPL